ncbi:protein SAR DEFICIENT 1 [Cucumis melo var. makuwa]|uniref:Protein SAR DEFICIENT 1 n=1 Tax=Cucumis melo var. makuwa TaxID=1194695 RepID=A0A5D3BI11_CUCMM|nr:protein SAR DEFICIENT 1 [Cucumis melo var. makuwa]
MVFDGEFAANDRENWTAEEFLVVDDEFAANDGEDWTGEEFIGRIVVKESSGKKPLLHGEMNVSLRHGS